MRDVRDEVLMGAFMNGLKVEVYCDVKLMHPQKLKQAMNFASQVKDRNRVKEIYEEETSSG